MTPRLLVAIASTGLLLSACGKSGDMDDNGLLSRAVVPAANNIPDQEYDVRGEITKLPSTTNDLEIHHEAIPEFIGSDGEVEGMNEMAMPFPLYDGLDIEGFEVGDKVAFRFGVWWEGPVPTWKIYEIRKIEPETELKLGG